MPYTLNQKLAGLVPYDVDTAKYDIRLDANESFKTLPDSILSEVQSEIGKVAFNRYPDPKAAELCAAFAKYYGVNADSVTAGNGSDELLYIISTCFTMAGDTVVTTDPDFSMYRFYSHLAECRSVVYNKSELEVSPDELIKTCNENNAKLLIFSNPCNPSGRGMSREDVIRVVSSVDALVVVDEAYMDFWNQSVIDIAADFDNVILLKTMSKAVGCAALRLGFAVANNTLTNALRAAKSPYNINSVSAAAGKVIYSNATYLDESRDEIIASRDALYESFKPVCEANGWNMKAPFANFIYIETENAAEIYESLKKKGISVRNFGKALRITAGSPDENKRLIDAVKSI